jgi:hypothetical protein
VTRDSGWWRKHFGKAGCLHFCISFSGYHNDKETNSNGVCRPLIWLGLLVLYCIAFCIFSHSLHQSGSMDSRDEDDWKGEKERTGGIPV